MTPKLVSVQQAGSGAWGVGLLPLGPSRCIMDVACPEFNADRFMAQEVCLYEMDVRFMCNGDFRLVGAVGPQWGQRLA